MLFDGMTEEAMNAWVAVKEGSKLFVDLPAHLQSKFIEIEAWNRIENDLKEQRQRRSFGNQGTDYYEDPRDRYRR